MIAKRLYTEAPWDEETYFCSFFVSHVTLLETKPVKAERRLEFQKKKTLRVFGNQTRRPSKVTFFILRRQLILQWLKEQ